MRFFIRFFTLFFSIFALLTSTVGLGLQQEDACIPLTVAKLDALLAEKEQLEVVFFSSWCTSCVHHLKEKETKDRIFVVLFDSCTRAQRALKAFQPNINTCYKDAGVAAKYRVKALPKTLFLEGKKHVP